MRVNTPLVHGHQLLPGSQFDLRIPDINVIDSGQCWNVRFVKGCTYEYEGGA